MMGLHPWSHSWNKSSQRFWISIKKLHEAFYYND